MIDNLRNDAVTAYRRVLASAKWNDRRHRTNVRTSMAAIKAYADAAGITAPAAAHEIRNLAR